MADNYSSIFTPAAGMSVDKYGVLSNTNGVIQPTATTVTAPAKTSNKTSEDQKKRLATAKALMSYAADPMKQEYVDGVAVQSSPLEALSRLGSAAAGAYIQKKNQTPTTGKGGQPPAPKV
jgi:hypothetical protein